VASQPKWLAKYLRMSPEVRQVFNDLDAWLNYCRFRMIKYDEADLYKSVEYREWQERRKKRQQWQQRNGQTGGYQGRNPR
jgi:hypothetical protein